MFTANFPKHVMTTRFPFAETENDWVISINDPEDEDPVFPQIFEKVWTFRFHDIEWKPEGGAMIRTKNGWESHEWTLFNEEMAAEMAGILRSARSQNKNVWVHCHAGICRSGAVVEVMGMLGWDIVPDFSPQREPNTLVKHLLMKQFPEFENSRS